MTPEEQIARLLTEIRDLQQEHIALSRDTSERLLAFQERGLIAQRRHALFYRWFVGVTLALFAAALYFAFIG